MFNKKFFKLPFTSFCGFAVDISSSCSGKNFVLMFCVENVNKLKESLTTDLSRSNAQRLDAYRDSKASMRQIEFEKKYANLIHCVTCDIRENGKVTNCIEFFSRNTCSLFQFIALKIANSCRRTEQHTRPLPNMKRNSEQQRRNKLKIY